MITQPLEADKRSKFYRDLMDLIFKDDANYILIAKEVNGNNSYIITNAQTEIAYELMYLGHVALEGDTPKAEVMN